MFADETNLCQETHPGLICSRQPQTIPPWPPFSSRSSPPFLARFSRPFLTRLILRGRQAGSAERLRSREDENLRLNSEVLALRAESARLSTLNTQLQTQLTAERDAQVRLANEFKALSADALSRNNTSFLELAKESFRQAPAGLRR